MAKDEMKPVTPLLFIDALLERFQPDWKLLTPD